MSETPSMRLDGMVAVVTGAGGELGRTGVLALAEAGADVVLAARNTARCEPLAERVRGLGRQALVASVDITDGASCRALAAAALARFGKVDILFNNAGIHSPKSLVETTEAEWIGVINTNVVGTFLCTKAFVPAMIERRFGRIINMGSILSRIGVANRTAYGVSKAAVASFAQSLALELGPHNITVNALGPTVIETDLNREHMRTQPQLYQGVLSRMPLGRFGRPQDVAGALVFLASPAAAFVTGQTIYIDGGYTAG